MDEKVKEAFYKIYEGEAKAALRLKLFANKADEEDLPQIAKLFRVIAFKRRDPRGAGTSYAQRHQRH
jgi:rubrerythrin